MTTLDLRVWTIAVFYAPSGYAHRWLNCSSAGIWRFKFVWGPGRWTPAWLTARYQRRLGWLIENDGRPRWIGSPKAGQR